jgi:cell division protein ZapA (FtsZ GTPase activity inhibitor)
MDTITVWIGGVKYTFDVANQQADVRQLADRADQLVTAVKAEHPTATNLQCTTLALINLLNDYLVLEAENHRLKAVDGARPLAPAVRRPVLSAAPAQAQPEARPAESVGEQTAESNEAARPSEVRVPQTRNLMTEPAVRKTTRLQGVSIDPLTGKPRKNPKHVSRRSAHNPFAEFRQTESRSVDPLTGEPKVKAKQPGVSLDPFTGERRKGADQPADRSGVEDRHKSSESSEEEAPKRRGRSLNPFF